MKQDKNQDNFGLPNVGYGPMETIEMEGNMFRSMKNKQKTKLLRVSSILSALFILILPGVTMLTIIYSSYFSSEATNNVFSDLFLLLLSSLFGLALLLGGIKVIISNI
jgi:hypothetical protein